MSTAGAAVATLVVLLGPVAGCSQDPQAAYCEVVEANREQLGTIVSEARPDALVRALPVFTDLADAAPEDISGEWRTALTAVRGFADALAASGVDPAQYDPENPPEQLSDAEQERLRQAASRLVDPRTVAAFGSLEQHALDVCGMPLGL